MLDGKQGRIQDKNIGGADHNTLTHQHVMFPNYVNVIVYNSFYEIGIKILADSIIHTVLGF